MHTNQEFKNCADECYRCQSVCLDNVNYCLEKGGRHVAHSHLQLMLNCGEICQANARVLLSDINFSEQSCGICAAICERCALECEQFENDAQMKSCADTCKRCAQSCRSVSNKVRAA